MNEEHKGLINILLALEWILLVTVMFGGEALLRLSQGSMTEHTERYFRAGHAHAGVMVGIGMVMVLALGRTSLGSSGMVATWLGWVIGVVLLSGGFFVHAYSGETGEASVGTWMDSHRRRHYGPGGNVVCTPAATSALTNGAQRGVGVVHIHTFVAFE